MFYIFLFLLSLRCRWWLPFQRLEWLRRVRERVLIHGHVKTRSRSQHEQTECVAVRCETLSRVCRFRFCCNRTLSLNCQEREQTGLSLGLSFLGALRRFSSLPARFWRLNDGFLGWSGRFGLRFRFERHQDVCETAQQHAKRCESGHTSQTSETRSRTKTTAISRNLARITANGRDLDILRQVTTFTT